MGKVLITDAVHSSIIGTIEKLGFEVTYIPKLEYAELDDMIADYEGIIINSKIIMDQRMIDKAGNLHFIGRLGSGLDIIDLEYAKKKGIAVLSAPEGNSNAVGEHALGMLLSLANHLNRADREVRQFKWNREKNRGFELEGKKIGIIGYGHTGPAFAEKLQGFRAQIYVYDKYRKHIADKKRSIMETSLTQIQRECDIISIHLPLTPETKNLVNQEFFEKCLKRPVVINTSRGKILKIEDLLQALKTGRISGACLDVFENEKPQTFTEQEKHVYEELYASDKVLLTPHIAGWTKESKKKIASTLIAKIKKHLESVA
ncbi:NAD(P)-dependent oxidoreductase [Portibacter marinus]|uniref:NAD(P)-dependent oxidoreductase n=1 Tax=Portibacter marinus TaxID=2898660 RepID=UPI001F269AE3|nr:NAD(P)-dependent oxidoreductase [Portibacter marinus]